MLCGYETFQEVIDAGVGEGRLVPAFFVPLVKLGNAAVESRGIVACPGRKGPLKKDADAIADEGPVAVERMHRESASREHRIGGGPEVDQGINQGSVQIKDKSGRVHSNRPPVYDWQARRSGRGSKR